MSRFDPSSLGRPLEYIAEGHAFLQRPNPHSLRTHQDELPSRVCFAEYEKYLYAAGYVKAA